MPGERERDREWRKNVRGVVHYRQGWKGIRNRRRRSRQKPFSSRIELDLSRSSFLLLSALSEKIASQAYNMRPFLTSRTQIVTKKLLPNQPTN
jgi:hypothetical protein